MVEYGGQCRIAAFAPTEASQAQDDAFADLFNNRTPWTSASSTPPPASSCAT
jgi:hypothetical protein